MVNGIRGNAHTGIGDPQNRIILGSYELNGKRTAGYIILDSVFHQIKNNLIKVIFQNQDGAVFFQIQMERDVFLNGVLAQHAGNALNCGSHKNDFTFLAGEPFGFCQ